MSLTTGIPHGPIQLGLDGLPSALASMSPGLLYGLCSDNLSLQFGIAVRSLSLSANPRTPSVFVTTQDPERFLRKASLLAPRLPRQVTEGQARVLRLDPDIERYLLQFGLRKLIDDLHAQRIVAGSLVIIEQSEIVLGLSDPIA
jgi:hypothetical protein